MNDYYFVLLLLPFIMSVKVSRAPKRRIERFRTRMKVDITTTDSAQVLHLAEDAKTLIRILVDIVVRANQSGAADYYGEIYIGIEPAQTQIGAPSITADSDQPVPLQEILRIPLQYRVLTTNGDLEYMYGRAIYKDTKAMRKLKEGDRVIIRHLASSATCFEIFGNIYTWFKE